MLFIEPNEPLDHGTCPRFQDDPIRRAIEGFIQDHPGWIDLKAFVLSLSSKDGRGSVITHFTPRQLLQSIIAVDERSTVVRRHFVRIMELSSPNEKKEYASHRTPTMYEILIREFHMHPSIFRDNRWFERGLHLQEDNEQKMV